MNSSDKEGGWSVAQTHLNPSGEGMGCSSVGGCSGLLTYATPHPPPPLDRLGVGRMGRD